MSIVDDARQCQINADIHRRRSERSSCDVAREANLRLAAIYAAQSARLHASQKETMPPQTTPEHMPRLDDIAL